MSISPLLLLLLLCSSSLSLLPVDAAGTTDGSEEWGYVQVRPRAHMFWWLYRSPQRVDNGSAPWPTVLWLQGGPGGSGVGIGNFQEIGPLDVNLQPRSSTWLHKADLLFVDNPVGTGYSFVEAESLFVKSDWEAATDLTTLLKKLYHEQASSWQNSPLFIVAESYGGKFAVTAGLSIAQAIRAGELKLKLGGVALGDSWISPEDFVASFLSFLRPFRMPFMIFFSMAEKIRDEIKKEQYGDATNSWGELEEFIVTSSNDVDFYNFLLDSGSDPVSLTAAAEASRKLSLKMYSTYLTSKASTSPDISGLMNGVIKEKLKIIPKNVSWGGQSGLVFDALSNDFMKPRINEVDELLSLGIDVTIYNGQVDLICATKGTEAWVRKLKWDGLKNFNSMDRKPIYCSGEEAGVTKGFLKSYHNLHFYWILGAGHFAEQSASEFDIHTLTCETDHFLRLLGVGSPTGEEQHARTHHNFSWVPVDQPCVSLKMIADITRSPPAGPS
ncbi:Nucleotidyltransferase domain [Musa troglodytarum]|uniref:Carboxypeptidase n=1 Tax=Musa troglodytarum TaxID=320322 RepID=A0A9E7GLV4_9LILI|nr:Nucleotidyltransferase domain [Musa troglodytarum]URE17746.1 Nucleotidyltransferase domain [Musa troglodytarum]